MRSNKEHISNTHPWGSLKFSTSFATLSMLATARQTVGWSAQILTIDAEHRLLRTVMSRAATCEV